MSKERSSLGLGGDAIDLADLVDVNQPRLTPKQQNTFKKGGEKRGFVSRQPKRRRRVSPYQAQFGGKCREEIKQIFQEAAARLNIYDAQALERAIGALIKQEGFDDLVEKYKEITEQ